MISAPQEAPKAGLTRFDGGPRQVLALHCSLAHGGAWAALAEALHPDATMIAPDHPGHGRNPPWSGQGDILDTVTETAADLLDSPMDVIGHSFGAVAALNLAMRVPDKIRSLTLFDPVFFAVALVDAPEVLEDLNLNLAAFGQSLERGDHETATRTFVEVWGDGRPWSSLPDAARSYMVERIGFVRATRDMLYTDSHDLLRPDALRRVTMPTLVLQGQDSPAVMSPICAGLAERLANARSEVLPDVGHMGPISHAKDVAQRVRHFWSAYET